MIKFSIDPDTHKSGIAIFNDGSDVVKCESLTFPDLVDMITSCEGEKSVVIEAGWANESYFHLSPSDSRMVIAKKGYNVGENHRTGKLIVEYLKAHGVRVDEVKPLRKLWRGRDRKITHDELTIHAKQHGFTLSKNRTNQDERDAVLLGLVYFGIK